MVDLGKKFDNSSIKKVIAFLFGPKDGQLLDTATDIKNKQFYKTLTYYRILDEEYGCDAAKGVCNILERLAISTNRGGRLEATNMFTKELPKEEILLRGMAKSLEEQEQ